MYHILVSAMAYDGGRSGISVYISNVIKELAREHQLTVLALEADLEAIRQLGENLRIITVPMCWASPLRNMFWHLFIMPWQYDFSVYDFIFLPAGNRRLMCRYPRYTLVTVHDFSQYYIPGKYDLFRMFYIKKIIPFFLRRAPHLITVSESTLRDTVKFCHIPVERITVNHNGYDRQSFNYKPDFDRKNLAERFGLTGDYLLYIARIEHPGKNHINLIRAYEKLPPELAQKYPLIFAGSKWSGAQEVVDAAGQSYYAEHIRFLGFVGTADLPDLYRGAALYVFPSLYEGFGLPVVEAMACGTPVVCSNRSSLPEVGGDAVITFDPEDPEAIAAAIRQVLDSPARREEMSVAGLRRAGQFSWETHARKLIETYESRY